MASRAATTTSYPDRLRAAADEVEELEEALNIARARRDELIATGYDDEGMNHAQLVAATRLSRTSIIRIIADA